MYLKSSFIVVSITLHILESRPIAISCMSTKIATSQLTIARYNALRVASAINIMFDNPIYNYSDYSDECLLLFLLL